MSANLLAIFYLISGILFILALRGLSSPDTSRQGNYFGMSGMLIAIIVTFLSIGSLSTSLIYVLVLLAAQPTGVNPFLFASRYNVGQSISSGSAFLSTIISIFTLSILLTILN